MSKVRDHSRSEVLPTPHRFQESGDITVAL